MKWYSQVNLCNMLEWMVGKVENNIKFIWDMRNKIGRTNWAESSTKWTIGIGLQEPICNTMKLCVREQNKNFIYSYKVERIIDKREKCNIIASTNLFLFISPIAITTLRCFRRGPWSSVSACNECTAKIFGSAEVNNAGVRTALSYT